MDKSHDDHITLVGLKFVCGESKNVCRLCLSPTKNNEINLEIMVKLQTLYYSNSISYRSMLSELNVPDGSQLPQMLCKNCAKITVNCYLFQKLSQYSHDKWLYVLNMLQKSLCQLDTFKQPETESAYLILNKSDNLVLTSSKSFEVEPKKVVVLKDIMKSCQRYIQTQKKLKESICNHCGQNFDSKYILAKHVKAHNKTLNSCNQCSKSFSTPNQLHEHEERVHYPKNMHCDKCANIFSTAKMLRIHENNYHIPAKCKLCNLDFPSRKDLRVHLDHHNTNICTLCKKKFNNIRIFKNHINRCGLTKDKQDKYICDICNKCYSRKNGIRVHLRTEHGFGEVLSCSWCDKKFVALSRLKYHIVKHTKEKNFHCSQCGGHFVTYAALVSHTRLHTGEKPFACDLCDESFLSASRRMEHKKRKHIGPTKECTLCNMKFITSFELKNHFYRHFNPASKLFITKADLIELRRIGKVK